MGSMSRACMIVLCAGCLVGSSASCSSTPAETPSTDSAAASGCVSGVFDITTPLALSTSKATPGTTVDGAVTYTNGTSAPVTVKAIVIANRPPGGTHAGGPYDDFSPWQGQTTIAPGASITVKASRTFGGADPYGTWETYATYEDAKGVWHDAGSSVMLAYGASSGGGGGGGTGGGGGVEALKPPPAAAAAGYTHLAFDEEFDSTAGIDMNDTGKPGFTFYRRLPFGFPTLPASAIKVENGALTIDSQTGPNMGLVSICGDGAGGWTGFAAGGGAYFEASVSFDPNGSGAGWPSFWSMAAEHLYGSANEYIEVDFFEYDTKAYDGDTWGFGGAIHDWVGGSSAFDSPNYAIRVPHSVDWNGSFNTIGSLWIPGKGIDMYFDDAVTTDTNPYSKYPKLAVADQDHWPVILGSDGWPMRVDWVRVWTK